MKDYNNFKKFNTSIELKSVEKFLSGIQALDVMFFVSICCLFGLAGTVL